MKKSRRKGDIKSKLVAAICMLMVSCIMVVSSTYAWFTLSTAPEVTGITTAIGANGNLEMALLPSSSATGTTKYTVAEALAAIGNATGSESGTDINLTWGNLVDLSNASYGLNKITLYPSKLNYTAGSATTKDTLGANYLGVPEYGSDGRFDQINNGKANAFIYTGASFDKDGWGVRAIGTSSGESAQKLAYKNALNTAISAHNEALKLAKEACATGGSQLGTLAVKKATDSNATYTQDDVAALENAYKALDLSLDKIEESLKYYIIANYLANHAIEEIALNTTLTTMEGMALSALKDSTYSNTTFDGYVTALAELQSKVNTNLTTLDGIEDASFAWSKISGCVSALANVDAMKLNGELIDYYMEKDSSGAFLHASELINAMSSGNLQLQVNGTGTDNDGLYVGLANFVDSFSTPVTIRNVSAMGITVSALNATMLVTAKQDPAYLPNAKTVAKTIADESVFGTGSSSLSDFYGYIIDLAFRTNASDSQLLLQTDAIDRIYSDKDGDSTSATMGGGSTMSFKTSGDFTADQLAGLMSNIRVVLFNPENSEIYGYARLDASTKTVVGSEVTMKLKMWDMTANAESGEGSTTYGAWASTQKITDLTQNKATAVSALVYLDGENLTNADVGNAQLEGKMNIQFSSSAALTPMEYGDLRNETLKPHKVYVNNVEVSGVTVENGGDLSLDLSTASLPSGVNIEGATITVKVNDSVVDNAYNAGTNTITLTNVTGNVEITVTPA